MSTVDPSLTLIFSKMSTENPNWSKFWVLTLWDLTLRYHNAYCHWCMSSKCYWVELFAWKIAGSPTQFWAKWASIKRSVSLEWKVNSCPASAKTKLSRGTLSSLEKTVGCQSHLTKLANSKMSLLGEQISRWNPRSCHQHNFRLILCKKYTQVCA